jgi:hypothetical protein
MNHRFYVESPDGEIDIYELVKDAIEADGGAISRIQGDCGFVHPRLADIRYGHKGKRPGIATLLIALMEMGYEIRIEKPKPTP